MCGCWSETAHNRFTCVCPCHEPDRYALAHVVLALTGWLALLV